MEDDLLCEYDSTWDTESDGDELEHSGRSRKTRPAFWSNSSSRNLRAAKDMQNYRHGYPNINEEECPEERMTNLKFYLNEIKSSPDDVSIETFHTEWRTDYKRLERVHSYIQWLFPLREPGVNYMAAELTKKEIQAFRESEEAKSRLLDSYELMLGFYGLQLLNRETGEVKRADNWRERFANLERNMHNNLRITRILKSLGELGFEHFQAPLVRFFLEETLVRKTLSSVKRSVLDYFLFAVRDKRERRKLVRFAFQHFEPKDKFVWCPRKIQKRFKKKSEKRQNSVVLSGESAANEDSRYKSKDGEADAKHCKSTADITDVKKQEDGECESRAEDPEKHTESDEQHLNNGQSADVQPADTPDEDLQNLANNNNNVSECEAGAADCTDPQDQMDSPVRAGEPTEPAAGSASGLASGASRDRTDSPECIAPSETFPQPDSDSRTGETNGLNHKQPEPEEPMDTLEICS